MSDQPETSSLVVSICYLETNSNDVANLGMYVLESGPPLFDIGILFAANINGTSDQPELYLNSTVTTALTSGIVSQLQKQGIKVTLSILGNHQEAGISTLTGNGPKLFAQQLADVVTKYGLDGIDFDDEYSTGTPNQSSFPTLVNALRGLLPDAILSLYFIGGASQSLTYGNINVGTLLNYAYNPYYSDFIPVSVPPMTKSQIGAAAINMDPQGESYTSPTVAAKLAHETIEGSYGVYIYYNLINQDLSTYLSSVSTVLYNEKTTYKGAAGDGQ